MQVIPLLVILITLSWGIEEKAADNARIAGCRRGSLLIADLGRTVDIVLLWNLESETLLALYPKSLPSSAFYQQSAEFEGRPRN